MKQFIYTLLLMLVSWTALAQTNSDPVPPPGSTVTLGARVVSLTDTVNRQLFITYGANKSDRVPRYAEFLRRITLDKHYIDSLVSLVFSGNHTYSGNNIYNGTTTLNGAGSIYGDLTLYKSSGGGTNMTLLNGSGLAITADGAGGIVVTDRATGLLTTQVLPMAFQVSDFNTNIQTQYTTDRISAVNLSTSKRLTISFTTPTTTSQNIYFPTEVSGTIALIGGTGGALPVSDTSVFMRKLLRYGATIPTVPAGYGYISLNSNGSLMVNRGSGINRVWASTYPGNSEMYMPYKASSHAADSTDIATKYVFSTSSNTIFNTGLVGWGDSMTYGTGSTPVAGINTFFSNVTTSLNYTGFNRGVSGETSTQIRTRFDAAPELWGYKTTIWAGRNDITLGVPTATIKANIAHMVSSLGHNNYIIIGVVYRQPEIIGTSIRDTVTQFNNDMAATYGNHFLNFNPALIAAYDPAQPQDVIDHNNGVFPSSLGSGDGTHLLATGQLVESNYFLANATALSTDLKIVTPENIAASLSKPAPIGSISPNTAQFTYVTMNDLRTDYVASNNKYMVGVLRNAQFLSTSSINNYNQYIENKSILAVGSTGTLYNIGLGVDVTGSTTTGGNIGVYVRNGSLIVTTGNVTSAWNNTAFINGTSQFGTTGSVNGDMAVANKFTLNQGTGGSANMLVTASGTGGSSIIDIGNTGASGVTYRFRVGGNTSNGGGGSGVNEGNLGIYETVANKIAIHIMKTSTNIGIHGLTGATSYFNIPAGTATAGTSPIKLTSGTLMTTPEVGAIEFLTDGLYYTQTTGAVRQQIAYLNSPTFITPNLGTPSALVLTNATGLPSSIKAGTITLVAGVGTATVTGITTTSRIATSFTSIGGTITTTVAYKVTCTTNTITITAITNTGTTDTTDTSTLAYFGTI